METSEPERRGSIRNAPEIEFKGRVSFSRRLVSTFLIQFFPVKKRTRVPQWTALFRFAAGTGRLSVTECSFLTARRDGELEEAGWSRMFTLMSASLQSMHQERIALAANSLNRSIFLLKDLQAPWNIAYAALFLYWACIGFNTLT